MGMFDYIKIKKEHLPLNQEINSLNLNWDDVEFQTKSLDNCLSTYIIDSNGDIFYEKVIGTWKEIPEEERKYKWNLYEFEEKEKQLEKINFHGILEFYCFEQISDDKNISIDFLAYFIYGKLDKIELKNSEYSPRTSSTDWFENYNKEQKKLKNKIKKFIRWKKFWHLICTILYKITYSVDSLRYFIYKNII